MRFGCFNSEPILGVDAADVPSAPAYVVKGDLEGLPDLKGKIISVRKSSSYYETLMNFRDSLGFKIELLPEDLETEDVLAQVATGKIAATVADSNIVQLELSYNNSIRSVGPLGDVMEIGWATRKNQPALKTEPDAFMKKLYKGTFYNIMVSKYFKDSKGSRADQKLRADKRGGLSPLGRAGQLRE